MTPQTAHRFSLLAAALLLVLASYSVLQPHVVACGGLAGNYPPILAFEFARSVGDLHALFGDVPGACRSAAVAGLGRINTGDSLLFIPVYGAFLIFSMLAFLPNHPRLARWAILTTLIACSADYFENICLFQLASQLDAPSLWLFLLPWATGVKWLLLALAGVAGAALLTRKPAWQRLTTGLALAGLLIVAAALAIPHDFGRLASLGVGINWLLFLIADVAALRQGALAR